MARSRALHRTGITTAYTWNPDDPSNTETSQSRLKTWVYSNGLPTSSTVTAVSVLVQPSNGDYLPGYFADAVHPNRPAYPLMAAELLRVIDSTVTTTAYRRVDNSALGS